MERKISKWILCETKDPENCFYFRNDAGDKILADRRFHYAEPFSDGYALVKFVPKGAFYFLDEDGNLSKGYMRANSYNRGFALVQIARNYFAFRDKKGNLSEAFYSARGYSDDGFAVVKKEEHGNFQIRNAKGELSQQYFYEEKAHDCIERGLAKNLPFENRVLIIESKPQTTKQEDEPQSGKIEDKQKTNLDKYFGYEATIYDLTPEEILANLDKIQAFEEYNYYMALEHCDSNWDMMELFLSYQTLSQYIKQTAYDAKLKTKKNPTLDEWREELKGKPLF